MVRLLVEWVLERLNRWTFLINGKRIDGWMFGSRTGCITFVLHYSMLPYCL